MIGEKIHRFEVLDSTNTYALKNHSILHDGDVVVALEQTSGRGREKRYWHSPRGGLWFSVVFKPKNIRDLNFYTKLASVSLLQVLKDLKISAYLKWPNDVYHKKKKLAGVLTEGIFDGEIPVVIVVGVGLNVNNEIPDSLKNVATSLKEIKGKEYPLDELLMLILKRMRSNWEKYKLTKGALTRLWKKALDLKEGMKIAFQGKEAKIYKILPDKLILNTSEGFKEVTSARELYG